MRLEVWQHANKLQRRHRFFQPEEVIPSMENNNCHYAYNQSFYSLGYFEQDKNLKVKRQTANERDEERN